MKFTSLCVVLALSPARARRARARGEMEVGKEARKKKRNPKRARRDTKVWLKPPGIFHGHAAAAFGVVEIRDPSRRTCSIHTRHLK